MKKTAQTFLPDYIPEISLLVLPIFGQFHFYNALQKFINKNPDHTVNLIELEEPELYKRIINGNFDIAITYRDDYYYTNDKYFKPVFDDEIVIAVNQKHELAQRTKVSPSDLRNQNLFLMEKYTCLNHLADAYLKKYDVVPQSINYGRPETILGGVEANCGIGFVSYKQAKYYMNKNIKFISFSPPISATLGVYINKNEKNNKKIAELINCLVQIKS